MVRFARSCTSSPNQRRRFGYPRLHILLRQEGVVMNRKKT